MYTLACKIISSKSRNISTWRYYDLRFSKIFKVGKFSHSTVVTHGFCVFTFLGISRISDAIAVKRMKIGQYCQRQSCRHVELEQFWQAFASRGFVSDSWAFLFTELCWHNDFRITSRPPSWIFADIIILHPVIVYLGPNITLNFHVDWFASCATDDRRTDRHPQRIKITSHYSV